MENTDPRPAADNELPDGANAAEWDFSARIAELENQLGALRDEQLRERAELDNQRKRLARDVEQARKFANEKLLGELLPLFDSMEAGLAAANFFRAHRSTLVNLKTVREIRPDGRTGFVLVMADSTQSQIDVSERQARLLRARIPGL